jgi:N-acetylglucosaminyldiphosphoundecaprenol N-acetyl-beta-D-mannosaminyltransferase
MGPRLELKFSGPGASGIGFDGRFGRYVLTPRIRIGTLWIDALSFDGALDAIDDLLDAGQGGTVFTPNVDHVVTSDTDPRLRDAYRTASLSIADGQWLIWASRLLGTPLPEKISGSDLVVPLARRAAARGRSLYLLGGAPGVAEEAARKLAALTGVRIVGFSSPTVAADAITEDERDVVQSIRDSRPDVVLVALGAPKQELFIHWNARALRPAVLIGVGASIDFLAGRVRRAPRWISRTGLEWLFRLALEPRRLARRYLLRDPKFVAILVRTLLEPRDRRRA